MIFFFHHRIEASELRFYVLDIRYSIQQSYSNQSPSHFGGKKMLYWVSQNNALLFKKSSKLFYQTYDKIVIFNHFGNDPKTLIK